MEQLRLWLITSEDTAFSQYIPGNFRLLLGQDNVVCVGALYGTAACGAALAQRDRWGGYNLRYIFIDPAARLCGLGTYLLRGLLGQLRARGAEQVQAVYTPSMLEDGRQTLGILERAGFTKPEPVSTGFSTRLGDIPDVKITLQPEMAVYSALETPKPVQEQYLTLLEAGDLPSFADMEELNRPWGELSSFCTVSGTLSGWFFLDRRDEGCHLACLYVLPEFRGGETAAALIARSIRAARELLPPETEVWTSAIDRNAFSLCDKLLRLGNRAVKETEFRSIYTF